MLGTSTSQIALKEQDELSDQEGREDPPPTRSDDASPRGTPHSNGHGTTSTTTVPPTTTKVVGKAGVVDGRTNDDDDVEHYCGWFGCRPRCLQKMNRPPWLLVVMCLVVIIQGMIVNGFTPGSIASIERRFKISSQSTGILASTYDITNIIFVLFVSYVGGRRHKLRWVSVGCVLLGVASFMYAIPHFATRPYSYVGKATDALCAVTESGGDTSDTNAQSACAAGNNSSDVTSRDEGLSNYIYLFCGAQVVAGLGSLPIYTLGLASLDESVSDKNYGPYFGILYGVGILGPGLGFLLSGSFLNIYTELSIPDGQDLSPSDPGWVGAWWLGFVISGIIALIIAIPLSLFPREFPTTEQVRSEKDVQAHARSGLEETTRAGFGEKPSDLLWAIKFLAVNPTFVFACLGGVADAFIIGAFNVFLPKFVENQFATTSGQATLLAGGAIIIGGFVGSLLIGLIMHKAGFTMRGLLGFMVCSSIVSALLFFDLLLGCPQEQLAGVTVSYTGVGSSFSSRDVNLTWSCNINCTCADGQYSPVCSEESGVQYFTPCHAGCNIDYENMTFGDCGCLDKLENVDLAQTTVTSQKCKTSCSYQLYTFIVLTAMLVAVFYIVNIAELKVVLRCVPESQRAMALGVNALLKRLFGSIPGPIVFGAVIDQACILWQDDCGKRGSCWIYDNGGLGWRLTVIALTMKALGITMYLIAMKCYAPAQTVDDEGNGAEVGTTENGFENPTMDLKE